jgi:Uma2 family endonuclease
MYALVTKLGAAAVVRVQDPIVLNNWSEPEPDIAVCAPVLDRYKQEHPRADQVLLLIEVAESSLTYDRTRKGRAYASSGIAEYWIVNLIDQRIEIFTDPNPRSRNYQQRRYAGAGDILSLPNGSSIAVADILP